MAVRCVVVDITVLNCFLFESFLLACCVWAPAGRSSSAVPLHALATQSSPPRILLPGSLSFLQPGCALGHVLVSVQPCKLRPDVEGCLSHRDTRGCGWPCAVKVGAKLKLSVLEAVAAVWVYKSCVS